MTEIKEPSANSITRVARRRAKPHCEAAYEALVRGMIDEMRTFPGFVGAKIVPPDAPGGEYQVITEFADIADLNRWDQSPAHGSWLERIDTMAEGAPEYRVITGLEAWFRTPTIPAGAKPSRWRMTVASWVGIFPTVSVILFFIAPYLESLPFLLRTAILTALVALAMTYVVMPQVTRLLKPWLTQK